MAETVATQTRARGRGNAGRGLGRFVAIALLLHLPLTPIGPLLGLLSLLRPSHEAPEESLNAIPVSLLSPEELAQMGLAEPPPQQPAPEPAPATAPPEPGEGPQEVPKPKAPPKPKRTPASSVEPDGGAPPADAGVARSAPPVPVASAAAGDGGAPAPVAESGKGGDPLALAGRAASVADPNANVRLLLFNDRIRSLPIAARLGRVITRLPQWRSFFGPTSLDPIRDVDRMYVAGPQFRVSNEVVAVVKYTVPQASMRKAIDGLVLREPKGEWLQTPIPAARARADRADRVFVLPKPGLLMMVPPHLADDAIKKAPGLDIPSAGGSAALIAFIANPWRALLGLGAPVELPKTIRKATLTLSPTEDGGATLHIDATDESPEAARADAAMLTSAVNALTQQNLGAVGALLFGNSKMSFIEPVSLVASGASIRGDSRVTPRQLERLLGFAEGWVDSLEGGPGVRPTGMPAMPTGSLRPSPSPSQ